MYLCPGSSDKLSHPPGAGLWTTLLVLCCASGTYLGAQLSWSHHLSFLVSDFFSHSPVWYLYSFVSAFLSEAPHPPKGSWPGSVTWPRPPTSPFVLIWAAILVDQRRESRHPVYWRQPGDTTVEWPVSVRCNILVSLSTCHVLRARVI